MLKIDELKKQIDEMVFYLDDVKGYGLFKKLRRENKELMESSEAVRNSFLVLQFLAIPHLSTREIAALLREHLTIGLNLEEIDLTERIKNKLILLDIADRDNFKQALKSALIANSEEIISEVKVNDGKTIRTVADWIKDYISNLQKQRGSALERAQYFYQQPYIVKLSDTDKNVLKKLFFLYQFLNTSSLASDGFEDDLLMRTEDGRLVTTNKGQIVTLYDFNKKQALKTKSYQTPEAKSEGKSELQMLRNFSAQYPIGSLERRAVEEEMEKLRKGEAKK